MPGPARVLKVHAQQPGSGRQPMPLSDGGCVGKRSLLTMAPLDWTPSKLKAIGKRLCGGRASAEDGQFSSSTSMLTPPFL